MDTILPQCNAQSGEMEERQGGGETAPNKLEKYSILRTLICIFSYTYIKKRMLIFMHTNLSNIKEITAADVEVTLALRLI